MNKHPTEYKELLKPTLQRPVIAPLPGDIVKVHVGIKEKDDKERIQIIEGLVISVKKPNCLESTFTVRKVAHGTAIEVTYPLFCPAVKKIEVVSKIHTRKAKLYYVRDYTKKLRTTRKTKVSDLTKANQEIDNAAKAKKAEAKEAAKEEKAAE